MGIYLFRNEQQEGPYDLAVLQQGLAEGRFNPEDPALSEEGTDWAPLHTLLAVPPAAPAATAPPIDPAIAQFLDDEQDPKFLAKIVATTHDMLTPGEEVAYVAIQKKPLMNFTPEAVLLTNKRLIIFKPKLMGMDFEEYLWNEVTSVHIREHLTNATVTCTIASKGSQREIHIDSIPKIQARRIYARVQVHEEQMREERKAKAADALHPHAPNRAAAADPVEVLSKLKKMLDAGLIKLSEYEAKKTEILSRM